MKKYPLVVSAILMAATANVWAGHDDDQRIIDAAAKHQVTAAQAAKAKDETAVTLTGTIVRQIKHEHYELQDASGKIGIEVDDDIANAKYLKVGTKVKVMGEVDTHRYKPTDVEVVKIEIIK